MKSILLALTFAMIAGRVCGQTLITNAQLTPSVGEVFYFATCSYSNPGPSGMNVTWDFSSANQIGVDTLIAVPESSVPSYWNHANDLVAVVQKTAGSIVPFQYFSDSVYIHTAGQKGPFSYYQSLFLRFPFKYNDSVWVASGSPGVNQSGICKVDGFGTLKLPNGTWPNVLRVHLDLTTGGFTVNQFYYWFAKDVHYPIASTSNYDFPPGPASHTSFSYLKNAPNGFNEYPVGKAGIRLFPNPATNEINIKTDGFLEIEQFELRDICGRVILNGKFPSLSKQISLVNLNEGVYMIAFFSKGIPLSIEKIVVVL